MIIKAFLPQYLSSLTILETKPNGFSCPFTLVHCTYLGNSRYCTRARYVSVNIIYEELYLNTNDV